VQGPLRAGARPAPSFCTLPPPMPPSPRAPAPPKICDAAVGRARRTASVLGVYGQPEDHPFPAACPELRYLKFVTHALD
jgi:hypothetical protein